MIENPMVCSFNTLKQFVEILDDNDIDYWLIGGWAVDIYLGKETREHRDIDLLIPYTKIDLLKEKLLENGFESEFIKDVRNTKLNAIIPNSRLKDGYKRVKVDAIYLRERKRTKEYLFETLDAKTLIDKKYFQEKVIKKKLNNKEFKIVPLELIFQSCKFSKKGDGKHLSKIGEDIPEEGVHKIKVVEKR